MPKFLNELLAFISTYFPMRLATIVTAAATTAAADYPNYGAQKAPNTAHFLRHSEHGCALNLASNHHDHKPIPSYSIHRLREDDTSTLGLNPTWVMYRDDPSIDETITGAALSSVGWEPTPSQMSQCVFNASVRTSSRLVSIRCTLHAVAKESKLSAKAK